MLHVTSRAYTSRGRRYADLVLTSAETRHVISSDSELKLLLEEWEEMEGARRGDVLTAWVVGIESKLEGEATEEAGLHALWELAYRAENHAGHYSAQSGTHSLSLTPHATPRVPTRADCAFTAPSTRANRAPLRYSVRARSCPCRPRSFPPSCHTLLSSV